MSKENESINENEDDSNKASVAEVAESTVIDDKDEVVEVEQEEELSTREKIAQNYAKNEHGYEAQDDIDSGEEEEEEEDEEKEDEENELAGDGEDELNEEAEGEEDGANLSNEPEMVEVKINGRTRQVEKEKVDAAGGVETYQKMVAANEGLALVNENQQILNERATQLQKQERNLAVRELALSENSDAQQSDLPNEMNGDQKQALKDTAKVYREALEQGEDDVADEALAEMLVVAQRASATTEDILKEVGDKASAAALKAIESSNYESDKKAANVAYRRDFPELHGDPRLNGMVNQETAKVMQEHPSWTPSQVITEAAARTQEWLDDFGGEDTPTEIDDKTDKLEEKRKLPNVRTSTGRKVKKEPAQKSQSNSAYIKQLRKERGLDSS